MRGAEIFERFFAVRRCASCGELMPYERREEAFCPECRMRWDVQKTAECGICGKAVCECACMSKALSRAGAVCHHKAVFYSSSKPVQHNTLMFIKRHRNPRVTRFLAEQLASVLSADKELFELNAENAVITFVPRSRRAVTEHGFDQSELLAEALSDILEIPAVRTVVRAHGGREQKRLSASERVRNASSAFEPCTNIASLVEGKRVILVDDVVTTGASMAACLPHLRRAGARETVCLSIASTEYSKK